MEWLGAQIQTGQLGFQHVGHGIVGALFNKVLEIVGGEGDYFNNFAKALSIGNAVNGIAAKSPMINQALNRLLNLGGATEVKPGVASADEQQA